MMAGTIRTAVRRLARGDLILLVGDSGTAMPSQLVFAADTATDKLVAFAVRYSSGLLYVTLTAPEARRLHLPQMCADYGPSAGFSSPCVAVDAAEGITTGISATDRARTARLLASPATGPADPTRPGHVLPVRVCEGTLGFDRSPDEAETAHLLTTTAGHRSAVLAALVSEREPTQLADAVEAWDFAREHDLPAVAYSEVTASLSDAVA